MSATIYVDCSSQLGFIERYEQYNNYTSVDVTTSKVGSGDRIDIIHWNIDIFRIWLQPEFYWNKTEASSENYDFPALYSYLDLATDTSDNHLLVTTGGQNAREVFEGLFSLQTYEHVIRDALRHYKERYPKIRYVEASNEYSVFGLTSSQYYQIYQAHYRAVNFVNSDLGLDEHNRLLLGGPVASRFDTTRIPQFLTNYADDDSIDKLLDFISYHQYLGTGGHENPRQIVGERSYIEAWLADRELDTSLPVLVTETGNIAPDDSGAPFADKFFITAAGSASIMYWYMDEAKTIPFNWVVHAREGENPVGTLGELYSSQFYDTDGYLSPYGKLIDAVNLMKATRVVSNSNNLDNRGIGVYGLASKDSTGLTVLTWNYQWNKVNDPLATQLTKVNINNLPTEFNGKNIKVRRFAIDPIHDSSSLDRIETLVITHAGSYTTQCLLRDNDIQLVELSPTTEVATIHFFEVENLTPVASEPPYRLLNNSDPNLSGTQGHILESDSIGDFIEYIVNLPSDGTWNISVGVKKFDNRGIFRLILPQEGNSNVGVSQDNYSAEVQYVELKVGNFNFTAGGDKLLRFEVVGKNTLSSGYSLLLDYIKLTKITVVTSQVFVEVENLTPASEPAYRLLENSDDNLSGSQGHILPSDSIGDFIEYTINLPSAGTWNISVGVKRWTTRGIFQLKLPQEGDVNVGTPQDNYSPTIQYIELKVGSYTFANAGNKQLRFEIVGKNSSSSGFILLLDYIKLLKGEILYEVENLTPVASEPSYRLLNNNDANLSGTQGHILESDSVGDFIEYMVNLPSAGTWNISVGVKKWDSRGIFQLKLPQEGNVHVGDPQDNYSSSIEYTELNVGNHTFASSGNKLLRFEIVGQNPASTGYVLLLDYIKLTQTTVVENEILVEVENLTPIASEPSYRLLNNNDANLSGTQGHILESDSVGDFIEYMVNLPSAGTWNISVGVKKWDSRGIFQLKLPQEGNVHVGDPQDNYSSSIEYTELNVGNHTFASSGNKLLRFEIVGQNPASTGYVLLLDYIKLTKQ